MIKLIVISTGTCYGYRKLTQYQTNITVKDIEVKSCLFGKLNRQIVTTDKGEFVLENNFKELINFEYVPAYLEKDTSYNITVYGLHYPQFHLYRTIVSQNGSPCKGTHCEETKSFVSRIQPFVSRIQPFVSKLQSKINEKFF